MTNMNSNKIGSVEGIRGIACLMVFLSHLSLTFAPAMHSGNAAQAKSSIEMMIHNSPFAFFYSGVAAVAIFFVLSGYILSHVILTSKNPPLAIASMALKRYWRLMIPAAASCLLAYAIFITFKVDNSGLSGWAQRYIIESPSFYDAIKTGAINAFFGGSTAYNGSLWTMKIELFGSVLVFFMCSIIPHIMYKKTFVIVFMLIPFFMYLPPREDIYYSSFVSGILVFLINKKITNRLGVALFLIGLFFCGFHYHGVWYEWIHKGLTITARHKIDNYILFNSMGGFLFVLSVIKTDILSKLFSCKLLQYLGAVSFSVYLIHQPLLHVIAPTAFNFISPYAYNYAIASLFASTICLVGVYFAAHFYRKYIDNFGISFSSKFKNLAMSTNVEHKLIRDIN